MDGQEKCLNRLDRPPPDGVPKPSDGWFAVPRDGINPSRLVGMADIAVAPARPPSHRLHRTVEASGRGDDPDPPAGQFHAGRSTPV